jgi:hypothetical protein
MHRRLTILILLAALLWQSLAVLGSTAVTLRSGELAHMLVHGQYADHHHHTDKSLHMDDGPTQHVHAEFSSNMAALLTSLPSALVHSRSVSPPDMRVSLWRSANLDGPLRPPMYRA